MGPFWFPPRPNLQTEDLASSLTKYPSLKSKAKLKMMHPKESKSNKAARKTKNVFQYALGSVKKSDPYAKMKYKEHLIAKRKKEFGVTYINMIRNRAKQEELQFAVESCNKDVDILLQEIQELKAKIDMLDCETRANIKHKPGSPQASAHIYTASLVYWLEN